MMTIPTGEIRNRDIVVFGLQSWDIAIGSTVKNIAKEFSRHNRVLFVNFPMYRSDLVRATQDPRIQSRRRVIEGTEPDLFQAEENLWVHTPAVLLESINWIRPTWLFQIFNKINNRIYARAIQHCLDRLGFKDIILFNDNSMLLGYHFNELLHPRVSVYLLRDNVIALPYHRRHGAYLQTQIIKNWDLACCNSENFSEYCRQFNPQVFTVGQGCDVSLYDISSKNFTMADDLKAVRDASEGKRPVIGYTGALTTVRLGIDILEHIAEQMPDCDLVLVGPEDEKFKASKLHHMPNVFFLGPKKPEQLPEYIIGFDVTINPQVINIITNYNYPLKIDEYLAMGKPVVATKTVFMDYFKDWAYLAEDKEAYIPRIRQALAEDSPEKALARNAHAKTHTWENFCKKVYGAILTVKPQF